MSEETHDIRKEVKKYLVIFAVLLVFTVLTVSASYLQIGVALGITVALIIASIKGYLVACNFMHLASEKRAVYFVLIIAVAFLVAVMAIFTFSHFYLPDGAYYVS